MSVEAIVSVIVGAATLLGLVVGGYWRLGKFIVKQFEAQEKARAEGRRQSETRLQQIESNHRELEIRFLEQQAVLPKEYVRREDHIRYETVVNAKLDALGTKLDMIAQHTARGA